MHACVVLLILSCVWPCMRVCMCVHFSYSRLVCFRIFDIDRDGVLNAEEQECLFKSLSLVEYSNNSGTVRHSNISLKGYALFGLPYSPVQLVHWLTYE